MKRILSYEHASCGRLGTNDAGVPEALAGGMVVEHDGMGRAREHCLGIGEPTGLREVDAEEDVGRALVRRGTHEAVRARKKLVDAGHHVIIGKKTNHGLVGPTRLDELDEGKLRS